MNQTISQKIKTSENEPILSFVSSSITSLYNSSKNITNPYRFQKKKTIKMNQTISQKIKTSENEPILSFVSSSITSLYNSSKNITNPYRLKSSKLQDIKYFHYVDTINGFSKLQHNWDSYNAEIISKTAIDTAIKTLYHLNSKGQLTNGFTVNIFPMRDGGIQFEFDGENICAELEINQNGDSTFILFDDDDDIIEKRQLFELSELSSLLEEVQYVL